MTIKDILKEGNRYEDVIDILNNFLQTSEDSYPVDCFAGEDGKASYRVDGPKTRDEALKLLEYIESEDQTDQTNNFNNLLRYIVSESDMMLHNYAISISHKKEPNKNMEVIRGWLILYTIVYELNTGVALGNIPKGWKRE